MTIIEGRRPERKLHTNLGHAKSAVQYDRRRAGSIWSWDTDLDDWVVMWSFPADRGYGYVYPWQTTQMKQREEKARKERYDKQVAEAQAKLDRDELIRILNVGWFAESTADLEPVADRIIMAGWHK
jgi:hypothetical protein